MFRGRLSAISISKEFSHAPLRVKQWKPSFCTYKSHPFPTQESPTFQRSTRHLHHSLCLSVSLSSASASSISRTSSDQMGNCLSPQRVKMGRGKECAKVQQEFTVKLILGDAKLQEFNRPVRASEILSQYPDCFICCSESMFIGSAVPPIREDEELQVGQIYFLMPLSMSKSPLSLQEMCVLATKASSALIGSHGSDLQSRGSSDRHEIRKIGGNR